MHVWGHQLKCQVLYAPSRVDGAGTLSYENIEQHWSKFYGYIASIQRMDCANRVDRIASLSEMFARKAVDALVENMGKDFKEAVKIESIHSAALDKLLSDAGRDEFEIDGLIEKQRRLFQETSKSGTRNNQADVDYANAIDDYVSLFVLHFNTATRLSAGVDDIDSDVDLDFELDPDDAAYAAAVVEAVSKVRQADLEISKNRLKSLEKKRSSKKKRLWLHTVDGCIDVDYVKVKSSSEELSDEHSVLKYRLSYLYNASEDRRRKAKAKVGVFNARKLHESALKLQGEYQAGLKEYNSKYSRYYTFLIFLL